MGWLGLAAARVASIRQVTVAMSPGGRWDARGSVRRDSAITPSPLRWSLAGGGFQMGVVLPPTVLVVACWEMKPTLAEQLPDPF